MRTRAPLFAALTGAVLLLGVAALAAAPAPVPAGAISFVAGDATRTNAKGKPEKLAVGAKVFEGDVIETQKRTRLEVKLNDGSVLRLGPVSKVVLESAVFGKSAESRKVSAKMVVGNVWANVAKTVGGEARFEVKTENAVAGVRGTTFRVDAAADKSCVVKVYSGTVAVASGAVPLREHATEQPGATEGKPGTKPGGKPERREIAGPTEVTREQWEKIVTNMMMVKVSADGTPSEPEEFAMAATGQDEFEEWNRAMDMEEKGEKAD